MHPFLALVTENQFLQEDQVHLVLKQIQTKKEQNDDTIKLN